MELCVVMDAIAGVPIQKDFRRSPNLGDVAQVRSPHPAQIGPGHLAAGSPLAHVAQLGEVA